MVPGYPSSAPTTAMLLSKSSTTTPTHCSTPQATIQTRSARSIAQDTLSINAATQVFAIPELLEHIILYLPEDIGDKQVRGQSRTAQLHALKGVSRSSYWTIVGSKKIQRLALPDPLEITWIQTAPLWWAMIVWNQGYDVLQAWERATEHGSLPEASWRRLKFLRADDIPRKVQFDHGIKFVVQPGETYGQITDKIHARRVKMLKSLTKARKAKKAKSRRRMKDES